VFSNYSYSLYGVVTGNRGWEQFSLDHPEALALSAREAETLAFHESVRVFMAYPKPGLQGWLDSFLEYFTTGPVSVYGFVSGGERVSSGIPESAPWRWVYIPVRLLLFALTIVGMGTLWRGRMHPADSLLFSGGAATLLGLSFIPARDAGMMRMHAVSLPFLLCLPALGWMSLFQKHSLENGKMLRDELHILLAAGLMLVLVMGFLLFAAPARNSDLSKDDHPSTCDTDQVSAKVRLIRGSYLRVIEDGRLPTLRPPSVRVSEFRNRVDGFYHADLLSDLAQIAPNTILMMYVDLHTGQSGWLIMAFADIPPPAGIINVCGAWHPGLLAKGLGFLLAEQVHQVSSAQKESIQ
jgi:hypothetical protein